jgi:ATP-dependent protease ClpP protease subunit
VRPSNIRCQQSEQGLELAILGEITSSTAEQIIAAANFFRNEPITITIMSGGGDAFASLGLHDYLKSRDVTVRIYGIAASGAAIISAAAKRTEMAAGAFLMIHNAYSLMEGQGEDVLESINQRQVDVFAAKTGQRKDKVKKMLEAETFLSAQEAYDMGFADAVFDPLKMAASLSNMKTMDELMKPADPGDEQQEKEQPTPEAEVVTEAEPTEEVEVEVPVTAVEAVQAAVRGHVKAKVNVAAKYGAIVAQLTSELKSLRAQLDEANAAVEAAEAKAAEGEAAKAAAEAAQAEAAAAQAQVEALKATPLEEPVKSDAQPTTVVPAAAPVPTMNKVTEHAQKMARTLDRLDRKLGIKKD